MVTSEPITATPPRSVLLPTMRQDWLDAVFVHWEIDPADAKRLLPPDIEPDLFAGRTFVGLIGLRIRVALLAVLRPPYLGNFAEVNVRLYSVDPRGRRGIVFRSLDADRLLPALAGRLGYRLPYMWSSVQAERCDDVVTYTGQRRWPDGVPSTRFSVRIGQPIPRPTAYDTFVTARWALHWSVAGHTLWSATQHPTWPLHTAELEELDDEFIAAAGLPPPAEEPLSVHWSPGVRALIGPPAPVGSERLAAVRQ